MIVRYNFNVIDEIIVIKHLTYGGIMMENSTNKSWLERNLTNRWLQLIVASLAMMMISNLQYSWTLFTTPLVDKLDSNLIAIQYAFTLFVMFQTFIQPAGGYLFDRFGSKLVFTISGLLVSIGWAMMGRVTTLSALYFFYSMSGVGAAVIYSGCVGISIKWFPDKRGLATGIIAGAFGLGSMPFVPLIDKIIYTSGVTNAFGIIGLMQGIVIIIAAFILRNPVNAVVKKGDENKDQKQAKPSFNPLQMLRTPHFWFIWTMAFAVNVGGLIITANSKAFGKSLLISPATIVLAVMMTSLANGLGRVFWGWVSDRLGRSKTMFVSFGLNAIFLFILPIAGSQGEIAYVIALMLVMFTWGQLFSLFPSLNADLFGSAFSAANNGFLNSSKGFAAILGGGLGAYLANTYGWTVVFSVAAVMSLYASLMSLVLPKLPKPIKHG